MNDRDRTWMLRALELAERGRGHVEPNPLVGAVIVRNNAMVGEGFHQKFGAAHAEVNALSAAVGQIQGATLYVTLEPCCHHGKTPPCTDAVINAGISRVVAAMLDPFPLVAGQGVANFRRQEVAKRRKAGGHSPKGRVSRTRGGRRSREIEAGCRCTPFCTT